MEDLDIYYIEQIGLNILFWIRLINDKPRRIPKGNKMNKSAVTSCLVPFLIVVALAGVAATSLSHASETATISIDPTTQQFNFTGVGDTIQVNIYVSNVQNLWSWDVKDLRFDPSVLNLTQITQGPFLDSAGATLF